ncbi:MAG TPA: hypothetical protein VGI39_19985 [Polyangiaceae bacterium]
MRRRIVMIALAFGTVAGYAAGFHSLHAHHHHTCGWHDQGPPPPPAP